MQPHKTTKPGVNIISRLYHDRRGLSLIELILVLSFLSIVLGVGYGYFYFSNNTFNKGENQGVIQHKAILSSKIITNSTRYAIELEILNSINSIPADGTITDNNNYIFVDSDGVIKKRSKNGTVSISNDSYNGVKFALDFKANANSTVLYFKINDTNNNYVTETSIQILNLPPANYITGYADGVAVRYITN